MLFMLFMVMVWVRVRVRDWGFVVVVEGFQGFKLDRVAVVAILNIVENC